MFMPVLKKNENYRLMYKLLLSEIKEVEQAIIQYMVSGNPRHRDELAGEIFDVIQVGIGFLDKLEKEGTDIEKSTMDHLTKLINRQIWTIEKMIKIEVL